MPTSPKAMAMPAATADAKEANRNRVAGHEGTVSYVAAVQGLGVEIGVTRRITAAGGHTSYSLINMSMLKS